MAQVTGQNGIPAVPDDPLPSLAAAFLVTFDNRKGYTIVWQKSIADVQLDGVVEFKSLPSGLHNVDDDLVYFVHDTYAGVSAFVRHDDTEEARNARMIAVGVLVPLEEGRLGKGFLYASKLKDLATRVAQVPDTRQPLEELWESHRLSSAEDSRADTHGDEVKPRSLSLSTLASPVTKHELTAHHPALALPELLNIFGPLLFPLIRAALLRRRLLILGEAPVELMCDFVYNISILSAFSRSVAPLLPEFEKSDARLRPLFNVGVADIATLEKMRGAWVACTTDDVLATKPHLFDVLVVLPGSNNMQRHSMGIYPKIIPSSPELAKASPSRGLRATQRDARRYAALKQSLQSLPSAAVPSDLAIDGAQDDSVSTISSVSTVLEKSEAIEPLPWSVVAYNSMIWWASAGDRRSGLLEAEELAHEEDESILRDSLSAEGITKEIAVVSYFHKLSALLFSVLDNAVSRNTTSQQERFRDDDDDDEDQTLLVPGANGEDPVEISEEDVRTMGLEIWSESDRRFISEMVQLWWKRGAVVSGGTIECCGLRIL